MTATTETTGSGQASRYALSNEDPLGVNRLSQLALILDEHSRGFLTDQGIAPGWQCLDVGPGAGTITAWMAEQVGSGGHVTAIDINPQHMKALPDNVTVHTADIRTVPLPQGHYDLIHARLVLLHIAAREAVLDRLVAALKPGGVLVVSDWDATWSDWLLHTPTQVGAAAFHAFQKGLRAVLEESGADVGWARRVPLAMRSAGLVDIDTVVHNRLWEGGTPGCLLHVTNAEQLRDQLLEHGVTAGQLDQLREAMHDPDTWVYSYLMCSTAGFRPEQ